MTLSNEESQELRHTLTLLKNLAPLKVIRGDIEGECIMIVLKKLLVVLILLDNLSSGINTEDLTQINNRYLTWVRFI